VCIYSVIEKGGKKKGEKKKSGGRRGGNAQPPVATLKGGTKKKEGRKTPIPIIGIGKKKEEVPPSEHPASAGRKGREKGGDPLPIPAPKKGREKRKSVRGESVPWPQTLKSGKKGDGGAAPLPNALPDKKEERKGKEFC